MARTYSWPLSSDNTENSNDQFARGMKFANVPGGRPEFIVKRGVQIFHVNCVETTLQEPSDKANYSGVIRYRFPHYRDNRLSKGFVRNV